MPKKRYQQPKEEPKPLNLDTPLPTHLPAANYYRQSTFAQVGNVATDLQTVDMAEHLKRLGWQESNIIMIDMDAGVSGTKRIDERKGMSELFRLISMGKVGAVSCQDEDRLFRDVTQIQVNIFIEACKQHGVLVITPSMIYNFAHAQMGTFHARQFRFKCEMASEFISAVIKGRLHPAKRRLLMAGRWAGPPMPPGYMADVRKELPSGGPNPGWRKFVIFEPFAEVVRAYWRLFLQYGGQIRPTLRHIHEHGPYYPDPDTCKPPEGFKTVYRIRSFRGKWCPASRTALVSMFTNANYVGHWLVNGDIVIWDNHQAIIEPDTFMRGFHYLSKDSLDGAENEYYNPVRVYARPSVQEERNEPWPLCAGLIFSQDENKRWVRVCAKWSKTNKHYCYEHYTSGDSVSLWSKKAAFMDKAVSTQLLDKLNATFDFGEWEQAVAGLTERFEEERTVKRSQLEQLHTVMENLVRGLGTLQHPQMIVAAERQYADAEAEAARLRKELADYEVETIQVEQIRKLRESCADIFRDWSNMERDEQREVVHTFVERIEATSAVGNGLDLLIRWKDQTTSTASLPNRAGPFLAWTEEEELRLITLMNSDSEQVEIARAFPDRTWSSIQQRYLMLRPKTQKRLRPRTPIVQLNETYYGYLKRTGEAIPMEMKHSKGADEALGRWTEAEAQILVELMESDAEQLTIAKAFPNRTWRAIKLHYWAIVSKGRERERKLICVVNKNETYNEYLQRIAQESAEDENSLTNMDIESHSGTILLYGPGRSHRGAASDPPPPTQHG